MRSQARQVRPRSVSQDWRKSLSSEKSDLFTRHLQNLEISYTMFSVSLDEALGLQRLGRLNHAQEVLNLTPELCHRLSLPLTSLLGAMLVHAKHFGIAPLMAPLNPDNFQSPRSQRVARFNELLSKVLFTKKSQFLSKISTLEDLVEDLGKSFVATASELIEEESVLPERDWELLDATHYDLNTCLRETAVLYKSFLHSLPEEQVAEFQNTMRSRSEAEEQAGSRHLAHRRIAFLKGQ